MAPRRPLKKHAPAVLLQRLASSDPETRWLAAKDLADHGDRSTVAPLERVALTDTDSFQREGAYVDTTEYPYIAALDALTDIHARHPPTEEDLARVRACLADLAITAERAEPLAATLGPAAVAMAAPLLQHASPVVRLRATTATARARRERSNEALWVDDEDVRLAATEQDAYRPGLYRDALARFPAEPSARVRRGLCDMWLRYRARMGGWLRSFELADPLVDPDPAIHARIAQHVLDTARARSAAGSTWIDDPGGLRPVRARLAALLAPGHEPPPAAVLREVLALIDAALAPFGEPAPPPPPAPAAPAPAADTDDWSVLTAPSPALAAAVRAPIEALGRAGRAALGRTIGIAVRRDLETLLAPWFAEGMRDHARVDVFDARPRGDRLVLAFIADHDNYNYAQAGSDWDDHYLFAGEAELAGGRLPQVAFALERQVHLTEHEHVHYDARAIRDLVRAELHARARGEPADRAAFDAAVARVRAASDERARIASEAAPAPPPPPPEPPLRCPTCAAPEVEFDLLFDAYRLACKRCGHSEVFETYPEQDSDAHWYA